MSEQFSIPTPGDVVAGKYHVIEELGRGAYGVVFRADQHDIRRTVALKTLLPQAFLQADIVQRFQREAQLISRLDHPNVIKLYDYGVDEGLLYMAVEFVEGQTLQDAMNGDEKISLPRVRSIVTQILAALEHAHEAGIVHRDLKPENIVLLPVTQPDGTVEEVVKVLDFGISKLVQGEKDSGALKTLTQSGTVLGTPHYMSPENIIGDEVDHTTDLYAIGILLYEMLVGEHPFEAQSPSAVMVRHLRDDPPELPPGLRNSAFGVAIQRALIKQPLERIQSAREMANILAKAPDEISPETDTVHAITEGQNRERNPMALAGAVGVIVLVLVISIGWKLWLTLDAIEEPVASADAGAVVALAPDVGNVETTPVDEDPIAEAEIDAGQEPDPLEFGEEDGMAVAGPANKEPDEKPEVEKTTPTRTKKVSVRVDSEPHNASVSIAGSKVGVTPLSTKVEWGEEPVEVRVSHVGYKNVTVKVVPSKDREVNVTLDKDRLKFID